MVELIVTTIEAKKKEREAAKAWKAKRSFFACLCGAKTKAQASRRSSSSAQRYAPPAARGKALILYIRRYPGDANRGDVVRKEVQSAKAICSALRCEYRVLSDAEDPNVSMTERNIQLWMNEQVPWLKDADHTVFIVAGHGRLGSLFSTDHVSMSEMRDFENIFQLAVGSNPEVYFYQNGMGDSTGRVLAKKTADDARAPRRDTVSNSFRLYASAPDFYAHRSESSSPFLAAIARAADKSAGRGTDMEAFETMIQEEFGYAHFQVPQVMKDLGAKWVLP